MMSKDDVVENIGYTNRYICTVFEEMRTCLETNNFSYLAGLIEEAQTYANRMESKLGDMKEYRQMKKRYAEMKKEIEENE